MIAVRSSSNRRVADTTGVSRNAHAKHTVPTGFCDVPPPGPAIPVTATATSAPARARAPSAIAHATASDTAPWASSTPLATPSASSFAAFEYVTNAWSNHDELPAVAVIAPATRPPVHDSAA